MEHPQVVEALNTKSIYELSVDEKMKILNCLMQQIMSFATVRDVIDENFAELHEAKIALRNHQWDESRRQKQLVEDQKQRRKAEAIQEKEDKLKAQEKGSEGGINKDKVSKENGVQETDPSNEFPLEAHLTERQRLAIQTKKEQEEKEK